MENVNLFDKAVVDVPSLFRGETRPVQSRKNPFKSIYRAPVIPSRLKKLCWMALSQTNVDQFWFHEFKHYWSKALGLRPMWGVEDFYFLRGQYRIHHQDAEMEESSAEAHVKAWQHPKLIYFLLQQIYVESKYRRFDILDLLAKYQVRKPKRFLEYGCGIGSITKSLLEFSRRYDRTEHVLCDIQTLAFHYAKTRFSDRANVKFTLLEEANNLQLDVGGTFDVIFCTAVFEHLNAPLETAKRFHSLLAKDGLFFFDYVKSDADGLDTQAGLNERRDVLEFISEKFELLNVDRLDLAASTPLVVARRK